MFLLLWRVTLPSRSREIVVQGKGESPDVPECIEAHCEQIKAAHEQAVGLYDLPVRQQYFCLVARVALKRPLISVARPLNFRRIQTFHFELDRLSFVVEGEVAFLFPVMRPGAHQVGDFRAEQPQFFHFVFCDEPEHKAAHTRILRYDLRQLIAGE